MKKEHIGLTLVIIGVLIIFLGIFVVHEGNILIYGTPILGTLIFLVGISLLCIYLFKTKKKLALIIVIILIIISFFVLALVYTWIVWLGLGQRLSSEAITTAV